MQVPPGSIQLTSDGLIFKHVEEEGDKKKRYSNFHGTIVGIKYSITSQYGLVINHLDENQCWITGYPEQESELFPFLPIVVSSMAVKEVCKVYFSTKYLLGGAPILGEHGRLDDSEYFEALVYLIDAEPIDYVPENYIESVKKYEEVKEVKETPKKEEVKQDKEIKQKKKPKDMVEKLTEMNAEKEKFLELKERKIKQFALNQLKIAEQLLSDKKIRNSRSEFNRARMAWGNQVDLSQAPDFDDERLNMDNESFKKYIDSRALFGLARGYNSTDPPSTDKVIQSLKEAITIDPAFQEAQDMLLALTGEKFEVTAVEKEPEPEKIDYENGFPAYDDPNIQRPQFWVDEIPFRHRIGYAEKIKEIATSKFKEKDFKAAQKLYNKIQIAFTVKSLKAATPENAHKGHQFVIVGKLNSLACDMELEKYQQAVVQADYILDYIKKTTLNFDQFKAKTLYRKIKALILQNKEEEAKQAIKVLEEVPDSYSYVKELNRILQQHEDEKKMENEFLYKKMTGKL